MNTDNAARCFLCGRALPLPAHYPNQVCRTCDGKALTLEGARPLHASDVVLDPSKPPFYRQDDPATGRRTLVANLDLGGDYGTNPVFIGTMQCWRRYRFGGWVTMADPEEHTTLESFYAHHGHPGHDLDCRGGRP